MLFDSPRDSIIALDILHGHDWEEVYDCLKSKNVKELDKENINLIVEAEVYHLIHQGYRILVILDKDYPSKILTSHRPPFVIYYKCKFDEIEKKFDYLHVGNPNRMFIE